jgi:light-independent protochlorophyllide reductase subunit B
MCRISQRATPRKWVSRARKVIFDTWVHPLVMGLEEHLLTMFREDFEFADEHGASASRRIGAAKLAVVSAAPVAEFRLPP